MAQSEISKEALFNEVKGSLFEYLVAKEISLRNQNEIEFLGSIDPNYLSVLSQQDRMVRQFYPSMIEFLKTVSHQTVEKLIAYFGEIPTLPKLLGKMSSNNSGESFNEADLLVQLSNGALPISLKLSKKNSFVNTKSGGIKSFFSTYFEFIPDNIQEDFNRLVDQEFITMASQLHSLNDLEFKGDFSVWIESGKSELPGELNNDERKIIKSFYARVASKMHHILTSTFMNHQKQFIESLPSLMGFTKKELLQIICFHDFKNGEKAAIEIYSFNDIVSNMTEVELRAFSDIASVELNIGAMKLQLRVKPMNKFTTTAIKINCSVKFKQLA